MHIWNQLTITASQEKGYNQMVGNTTELTYLATCCAQEIETICDASNKVCGTGCVARDALPASTLYIPLQFWYCTNPGLAIPLIALQYHEVKIVLELNYLDNMLWAVDCILNDNNRRQSEDEARWYFRKNEASLPVTTALCALLSTSTTSSWTPTSVAAWLRTRMSTSLSSSSSLVTSRLAARPTRSSLTSTTRARSSSGLFSRSATSTTALSSRLVLSRT